MAINYQKMPKNRRYGPRARLQAICLVGAALFVGIASPAGFLWQKTQFWKQQLAAMSALRPEDPQLDLFVLHRDEYARLRVNEREIRYQGIMYDLFSKEQSGDTLHILALADYAESGWMALQMNQGFLHGPPAGKRSAFFLFYFSERFSPALPVVPDPGASARPYTHRFWQDAWPEHHNPPPELSFFPLC